MVWAHGTHLTNQYSKTYTQKEAVEFCAKADKRKAGGITGWRLPTEKAMCNDIVHSWLGSEGSNDVDQFPVRNCELSYAFNPDLVPPDYENSSEDDSWLTRYFLGYGSLWAAPEEGASTYVIINHWEWGTARPTHYSLPVKRGEAEDTVCVSDVFATDK